MFNAELTGYGALILASFMVTTEDIPVAQLLVHKWSLFMVCTT
jgi:hypothetical protein